jgi:hydroxyversicolorone monooxygenase
MHYLQVIEQPRYEDFEIAYNNKNIWAHLGLGFTMQNRVGLKEADQSPYLNLQNLDPKW